MSFDSHCTSFPRSVSAWRTGGSATARRTSSCSGGELFLLRVVGLAIYALDGSQHLHRLRGGQEARHLTDPMQRRALLIFSLVVNFSFLGFFKYFNFFTDRSPHLLSQLGFHHVSPSLLRILLPPGISFYTFQEVAYIVDVYKGKLEPADSLVDYALFISLFPHLIAGPIQRPNPSAAASPARANHGTGTSSSMV